MKIQNSQKKPNTIILARNHHAHDLLKALQSQFSSRFKRRFKRIMRIPFDPTTQKAGWAEITPVPLRAIQLAQPAILHTRQH